MQSLHLNRIPPLYSGKYKIHVGEGSGILSIQAAIDSITDSSIDNAYLIQVLPGTYAPWDFDNKAGITVTGSGRSTIIETGSGTENAIQMKSNECAVENMQINYVTDNSENGVEQFCIEFDGRVTRANLKDLWFKITSAWATRTSQVFAIGGLSSRALVTGTDGYGLKMSNIEIETDMGGISHVLPSTYMDGVKIFMKDFSTTAHSCTTRTGFQFKYAAGRCWWTNGVIQTEYGFDEINESSITINGIHMNNATAQANQQLELRDVHGIIAINHTTTSTAINWIKMESTINATTSVRVFPGCRLQCEDATTVAAINTPWDYNTAGLVYVGDRGTFFGNQVLGNVLGSVITMDDNWDTWAPITRDVKAGGEWYADTSSAAFGIVLPKQNANAIAKPLRITCEFGGANDLTIGQGSGTPTFALVGTGETETSVVISPGTSKLFHVMPNGNYWVE